MPNDARAIADLAADALDTLVTAPAQQMHEAIAGRVFRAIGPAAAPVRVVHDGIATGVYTGLRAGGVAAAALAGETVRSLAGGGDVKVFERSRAGSLAQAAANALVGDQLAGRGSDAAITMAIRVGGRDVGADELGRAFGGATSRVAVFVHGLGEDDASWRIRVRAQGGATYGSRLREELGFTPVYVRYNTGLHVSSNGLELAGLLERLEANWPVPVSEIALIGHSMGGLVARAALQEQRRETVRNVVC